MPIVPQPRNTIISRRGMHIPHEDIRLDNNKISWSEFCSVNEQSLMIYQLVVSKLLSPITPLHLETLRSILVAEYAIPSPTVDKFFNFIGVRELKDMEFAYADDEKTIRLPILYKRPRINATADGAAYSVYVPSPRGKSNDRDGGLDK